jgi:ribosomal protein L12E/L44/L45/RPP1/RPP2
MTVRLRKTVLSVSLALVATLVACTSYTEIPIETPIAPKLDVKAFQRVYVAGFLAGENEDIDANMETVRLLRSQLRTKNIMRVIDADAINLVDVARGTAGDTSESAATSGAATNQDPAAAQLPPIKEEKDLEAYNRVFADKAFWKKIGDEYQQPLIVTGSVLFLPHQRAGFVQREQESYDSFGRRIVVPVRTYMERKGFILRPTFVFIDGRTGETLHSETFREEILYDTNQQTPALSSYFELMDRLLPTFLNTLSAQKIKGNRVLLK